jgi:hypothetical protein
MNLVLSHVYEVDAENKGDACDKVLRGKGEFKGIVEKDLDDEEDFEIVNDNDNLKYLNKESVKDVLDNFVYKFIKMG